VVTARVSNSGDGACFGQRRRTALDHGSDAVLGHGGQNSVEAGEASDRGVGAGARGGARAAARFGHGTPVGAGF
jgi:hypothetical protein